MRIYTHVVSKKKILVVFGTRPEAIKLAPLIYKLKAELNFETFVCSTGQHRSMLDDVLKDFGLVPDFDLHLMQKNQTLSTLLSRIICSVAELIDELQPDLVVVHGDTSTALGASIATFHAEIEIAHVEAGLRSGLKSNPFPEEMNRRLISKIADLHFAPTAKNRTTLMNEGISEQQIFITGNTVIDALLDTVEKVQFDQEYSRYIEHRFPFIKNSEKIILITCHRRENFGRHMENICCAINKLCEKFPNVYFVFPIHLNPNVQKLVREKLETRKNLILTSPLGYRDFATLLKYSFCVMTDSGGIQEEAPSLGKPVVVMRENTERSEGVEAGTLLIAGTNTDKIVAIVSRLVGEENYYKQVGAAQNPYGTGVAAEIIVEKLKGYFLNAE
jgi:UDP-N-acetylglucosamine 2-epimerase (non-hydrolysing)